MAGSNRAVENLRRKGDAIWEARVLKNRGLLLAERGDVAAAEVDLKRARDLYAGLGARDAAFGAELELRGSRSHAAIFPPHWRASTRSTHARCRR